MSHYFPTRDEMSQHTIFGKVLTRTCAGDHLQFSLAEIPDGVEVPEHSHVNEQMGIILSGTLRFTIAEETKLLKPGDVFRIPGGIKHSVLAVDGPVKVLDVFWPIREEYR